MVIHRVIIAVLALTTLGLFAQQPGPTDMQALRKRVAELEFRLKIVEEHQKLQMLPLGVEDPVSRK